MTKIAGYGSISQRHGSADPDPYENGTDPKQVLCSSRKITYLNFLKSEAYSIEYIVGLIIKFC
jgi:hypothetical protein